jgi:two-component system chemotaxis sensor kinase CheA
VRGGKARRGNDGDGTNGVADVPDKGDVDDLTREFIAESVEGLDRMERCLTELEVRPEDGELLAEIFRTVHTIKGTTGFLGFARLEKLTHAGENLLGALRDGRLAVSEELVGGLLRLLDTLRSILRLIETTGGEGHRACDDDSELIALLVELNSDPQGIESRIELSAEPTALEALEQSADVVAGVEVRESLQGNGMEQRRQVPVSSYGTEYGGSERSLRIGVDVLNRMMNLVGDLVLTRNQILQRETAAANFPELARRLDGITADLRETVMQARMQPVGHLFNKFPRMVRDLARICGREVRIEFSGAETGLDKSLLEAIKDPLTHAVRNAVDHGIEAPEQRRLAGKPAEGCVRLKAFHQSGFVVIEIVDDGAGIGIARVLAKAVERGLVTEEQAEGMTEREALQLIFLPGFSTAVAVTHVSGRGVGMDVVRANVEKVGGSVEIESRVGVGTTLRLRVPLTLAIVPALVVRSGGESFALPQNALVELVYVPGREVEAAVERIGLAEFYRLRERLLPLVWLDRLLGLAASEGAETQGFYIAVLEAEGRRYGLVVEELLAPEEIVVKPLSAVLREIGLFSGATVLGNGTLALILDVAETADRAGVKVTEGVAKDTDAAEIEVTRGSKASLLVFEDRNGERKALPLDVVERIESVMVDEIEYAGGRPMLQYRGELLALDDDDRVLEELYGRGAVNGMASGAMATVLICAVKNEEVSDRGATGGLKADGVRRRGRVVRQVLDVTVGTLLESEDSTFDGFGEVDLALVNERVTMVCQNGVSRLGAHQGLRGAA